MDTHISKLQEILDDPCWMDGRTALLDSEANAIKAGLAALRAQRASPAGSMTITEFRTKDILNWLDDKSRDHTILYNEMVFYRDAAALIRQLRVDVHALPARWYCVSAALGTVTLCKDEADARQQAEASDLAWPVGAPHYASQLLPLVAPPRP